MYVVLIVLFLFHDRFKTVLSEQNGTHKVKIPEFYLDHLELALVPGVFPEALEIAHPEHVEVVVIEKLDLVEHGTLGHLGHLGHLGRVWDGFLGPE